MKKKRWSTVFAVVLLLFVSVPPEVWAQSTIVLRPRPDSPTAMVRCGANLEEVKARLGATRRYVFTGEEILTGMRYCVREATTSVVDEQNSYRVPRDTVGWLTANGKTVVLEGCVNDAACVGCPPAPPTTTTSTSTTTTSTTSTTSTSTTTTTTTSTLPPHQCPECGEITFSQTIPPKGLKLTKDLSITLTAKWEGVRDITFWNGDQKLGEGITLVLTRDNFAGPGDYKITVRGTDADGHFIFCSFHLTLQKGGMAKWKKIAIVGGIVTAAVIVFWPGGLVECIVIWH